MTITNVLDVIISIKNVLDMTTFTLVFADAGFFCHLIKLADISSLIMVFRYAR